MPAAGRTASGSERLPRDQSDTVASESGKEASLVTELIGEEIAQQLGCSPRTVANLWTFAKRWLEKELAGAVGQ